MNYFNKLLDKVCSPPTVPYYDANHRNTPVLMAVNDNGEFVQQIAYTALLSVGLFFTGWSAFPFTPVLASVTPEIRIRCLKIIAHFSFMISGTSYYITLFSSGLLRLISKWARLHVLVQKLQPFITFNVAYKLLNHELWTFLKPISRAMTAASLFLSIAIQLSIQKVIRLSLQKAIAMTTPPSMSKNPLLHYQLIDLNQVIALDFQNYTRDAFLAKHGAMPLRNQRINDHISSLGTAYDLIRQLLNRDINSIPELSPSINSINYHDEIGRACRYLTFHFHHLFCSDRFSRQNELDQFHQLFELLDSFCKLAHQPLRELGYTQRPPINGLTPPHDFIVSLFSSWSLDEFSHHFSPSVARFFQEGTRGLVSDEIQLLAREGRIIDLLSIDTANNMRVAISAVDWGAPATKRHVLKQRITSQLRTWMINGHPEIEDLLLQFMPIAGYDNRQGIILLKAFLESIETTGRLPNNWDILIGNDDLFIGNVNLFQDNPIDDEDGSEDDSLEADLQHLENYIEGHRNNALSDSLNSLIQLPGELSPYLPPNQYSQLNERIQPNNWEAIWIEALNVAVFAPEARREVGAILENNPLMQRVLRRLAVAPQDFLPRAYE